MRMEVKKECSSSVPLEKLTGDELRHKRDACATLVNFDYGNPLEITKRNLPHWQQSGTSYFITFRLADSIPIERVNRIKEERKMWLMRHTEPYSNDDWLEYNRLFADTIQNILDSGSGSCILRKKEVSDIVKKALLHFNGKRYKLGEWVIMPNHVHAVLTPLYNFSVERITHSWKSYTAHKINKILNRNGTVWQHESYDHIIRNSRQLEFISKYIIENPIKGNCKNIAQCSSSVPPEKSKTQCSSSVPLEKLKREELRHKRDACATFSGELNEKRI